MWWVLFFFSGLGYTQIFLFLFYLYTILFQWERKPPFQRNRAICTVWNIDSPAYCQLHSLELLHIPFPTPCNKSRLCFALLLLWARIHNKELENLGSDPIWQQLTFHLKFFTPILSPFSSSATPGDADSDKSKDFAMTELQRGWRGSAFGQHQDLEIKPRNLSRSCSVGFVVEFSVIHVAETPGADLMRQKGVQGRGDKAARGCTPGAASCRGQGVTTWQNSPHSYTELCDINISLFYQHFISPQKTAYKRFLNHFHA